MHIHEWNGPGRRITSSEDVFFKSPLRDSTIFRFSTSYFEIETHAGEFSIKFVLSGEERYFFRRRIVAVRPGQFLLVNAGDEYSSLIDLPSESFSIFFRRNEFADAARSLVASAETLLEDPSGRGNDALVARIANRTTNSVGRRLRATIAAIDHGDHARVSESVHLLLLDSLSDHWKLAPPDRLVDIRRRSTRDELIARVVRAREVIDDSHGLSVDLLSLSKAACLSRFHFLRVFTEITGETPVAYARRRRLRLGAKLLRQGGDPLFVAQQVGYKNVRNFVRAYERTFGRPVGRPELVPVSVDKTSRRRDERW